MGLPRKDLSPVARCVHYEGAIAVGPIGGRFVLGKVLDRNILAGRVRIEVRREGILGHPDTQSFTDVGGGLEVGRLVIPRPGMGAGTGLADVAGQHQGEVGGAVDLGRVKPVIDPLADVNSHRLDGGNVLGELFDMLFGRFRDLRNRVKIIVL